MQRVFIEFLKHVLKLERLVEDAFLILLLFCKQLGEVSFVHPNSFDVADADYPRLHVRGDAAVALSKPYDVPGLKPSNLVAFST